MILKALVAAAALAAAIGGGSALADPPLNVIVGTPGPDLLIGTPHNDFITGRGGPDFIGGRKGNDILWGMWGNDVIHAEGPLGHSGHDIVRGGPGLHDRCYGDSSDRFFSCETVVIRNG